MIAKFIVAISAFYHILATVAAMMAVFQFARILRGEESHHPLWRHIFDWAEAHLWISGLMLLAIGIFFIDARALVWLLPVGLPLLLAIPMTVITSKVGVGTLMRAQNFLLIPEETRSPAVLRRAWLHASKRAKPLLVAA